VIETVRVLFENSEWIAVEKPSGMPTTAPREAPVVSLTERVVREHSRGGERPHPLSRLDVEVTGVVLFARTRRARELAVRERTGGRYVRRYAGLSRIAPRPGEGVWTWAIGTDPRDRKRRRADAGEGQQAARTRYVVLASGTIAWVRFDLDTGRTHQVRVHAARAGCALLGDRAYGGERHVVLDDGTVATAQRVMLHARAVRIPGTDEYVVAAYPDDWSEVWARCTTLASPDDLAGLPGSDYGSP